MRGVFLQLIGPEWQKPAKKKKDKRNCLRSSRQCAWLLRGRHAKKMHPERSKMDRKQLVYQSCASRLKILLLTTFSSTVGCHSMSANICKICSALLSCKKLIRSKSSFPERRLPALNQFGVFIECYRPNKQTRDLAPKAKVLCCCHHYALTAEGVACQGWQISGGCHIPGV